MLYFGLITLLLLVCTYTDLKNQNIYISGCIGMIVITSILHLVLRDIDIINVALGLAVGVIILLISKVTKEKIGEGDAWIVCAIGLAEGGLFLLPTLLWGLLLFNISGGVLVIFKRIKINSYLPLAPFLLVGNTITVVLSGGKI